ncbi:alkene reductase [Pseudomonas granadensis]|uniref:Alkene reductase n=1 Tax=Pseudomonas granadensis TaxID=1421430 RepID=A0ABX7GAV9_9PSED|nr:alkene reductase [Pseudomonas granadensis]MBN6776192.1 alkene reductase [Pseudomonas granadensis]MBN6807210.1 alkene reductase [Pseudomonas granadensis]MBN6833942.1 alkene reductase [Pseudomonas granadensis]MBN6841585.1 alkene reductase [Pseudomonas granadensis]MBN6870130.1 alkene reductase [Pseudomonas granadensis]
MKHNPFFTPVTLGGHTLKNRIVLPPLTRQRSTQPGNVANALMAEYYQQRAGAGLLITEGTQIEPRGQGYAWTPGIHTPEQIAGWRKVTEAVHDAGGVIFAQLWHVGRVSHSALQPGGAAPVSASAVATERVSVFIETAPGAGELVSPSAPRALSTAEVEELVQLYIQAARNAMDAGFDGIELHCANGYLVNQFISAHSNLRDDQYGGSLQNRLRFLRDVVAGVAECIGKDKVGVRFAPLFTTTDEARTYLGLVEDDPHTTYIEAIKILENVGIAYLSIAEADWDNAPEMPLTFRQAVRDTFSGAIIYAGRHTAESGARLLESGLADLVAFGRPFMANPDLPARIANGWALNALNPATVYGGGAEGYTDYPAYSG